MLSNTYDIVKVINSGTFSKLYEGVHVHKKTRVAIKCESDPVCKKLLAHEIEMYLYLKKYNNINIPTIKWIGGYENYSYIVMELFDINLREHFKNGVTKLEFICIVLDIVKVMRDFHSTHLLHRDIKPENFVLDKDKKIYIIDLGLACIDTKRELTQFIGNKRYASYSCHLPKYVYKKEDDIVSIIYMLLDLYTNKLPWDKDPTYEIKKNTDYFEFYKKKDYFVTLLLTMYTKINTDDDFYTSAIFELSRTVDYCKTQGK